jgi:hypothetical protein
VAKPYRYAENTDVPADRSRNELEKLLSKHGATEFGSFQDAAGGLAVIYRLQGRMIRHYLKPPEFKTDAKRVQERRRQWRALVLITKAKLELITSGDSTPEKEFLADMMLRDGTTVAESISKSLEEQYTHADPPRLRLMPGKPP